MSFVLQNNSLTVKPAELSLTDLAQLFETAVQQRLQVAVNSEDSSLTFRKRSAVLASVSGEARWRNEVIDALSKGPLRIGAICKAAAKPTNVEPRAIRSGVINTCKILQSEGLIEQIHEGASNFQSKWQLVTSTSEQVVASAESESVTTTLPDNEEVALLISGLETEDAGNSST